MPGFVRTGHIYYVDIIDNSADYFAKQVNLQEILCTHKLCMVGLPKASANEKKLNFSGEKWGDELRLDHKMDL